MKKIVLSFALVALIAAGCNKASNNDNQNTSQDQNQQGASQSTDQTPNTPATTDTGTNSQPQTPVDTNGTDNQNTPQVFAVHITSSGFSPSTITISKGDYVQFINDDTASHEPASNPHPTHTDYPGFDAGAPIATGKYYRFQFEKIGTWGYHDHLHSNLTGTVIVK